jgi:hypothetical protein
MKRRRSIVVFLALILPYTLQASSVRLLQTKYSKKAVRLVLKHRGKKVGSGTSLALLQLFEKKSRARRALKFSLSKKSLSYIAVGDELVFSGTYTNNQVNNTVQSRTEYSGPMHYAIVVGIKDDNTLIIAHQNIYEDDPKKAKLVITELLVEDSARWENINVYGLWPKRGKANPKKILQEDNEEYMITSTGFEKTDYIVQPNYTR